MTKKEKEQRLITRVLDDYELDERDRAWMRDNWVKYIRNYMGMVDPMRCKPWEDAADLNVPMTAIAIDSLYPRIANALFGMDPIVTIKPQEETDVDRSRTVEHFYDWQLSSYINFEEGLRPEGKKWVRSGIVFGSAVAKVRWEEEREIVTKSEDDLLAEYGTTDLGYFGDSAITEEEKVVYAASIVENISLEDFIVPSKATGVQPHQADHVIHRIFLPNPILQKRMKSRLYKRIKDVEKFIMTKTTVQNKDVEQAIDDMQGLTTIGAQGYENRHELLEWYGSFDYNDDGDEIEVIVTVHKEAQKLLRIVPLKEVFPHGKRPFADWHFIRIPGRFYGMGLPMRIEGIQEEVNTIHNQRVDFGTITNTPFGFYRPSSGLKPETWTFKPNQLYPVEDQSSVWFPQRPQTTTFGYKEESGLWEAFERLTGSSDLTAGRQPNTVGATRTATGTLAIIQEGNVKFNDYIQEAKEGLRRIVLQIHQLNENFLPEDLPGLAFRVTGRGGEDVFVDLKGNTQEIKGNFDFIFMGNAENSSAQFERESNMILFQNLTDMSRLPMAMQLGIVTVKNIYNIYRDMIRSFGKKDVLSYITEPKDPLPTPLDPNIENVMMSQGRPVDPVITENVQYHMQIHEEFEMSPAYQIMTPEANMMFQDHKQKTYGVANTQQQMMAQQAQTPPTGVGPQAAGIGKKSGMFGDYYGSGMMSGGPNEEGV
jgi:hypothetical protein